MPQLVTRIPDELAAAVDRELIDEGIVPTRSAAVRLGLERVLDDERRRRNAERDTEAYTRMPQTPEEVGWADAATIAMIEAEPW